MKIDSSQIRLSTRSQYLETIHAQRETRFEFLSLMDDENNVQARIKKSGLALNEDGSVASIVEMDWLA